MAKTQQKDLLARMADLGADALQRLGEVPGGSKLLDMANETRSRLDEMQKKLRGLDELEKRVAKLERELAKQSTTARKPAAARKRTTAPKPAAAKKPPA